jgi:hypothetical protein
MDTLVIVRSRRPRSNCSCQLALIPVSARTSVGQPIILTTLEPRCSQAGGFDRTGVGVESEPDPKDQKTTADQGEAEESLLGLPIFPVENAAPATRHGLEGCLISCLQRDGHLSRLLDESLDPYPLGPGTSHAWARRTPPVWGASALRHRSLSSRWCSPTTRSSSPSSPWGSMEPQVLIQAVDDHQNRKQGLTPGTSSSPTFLTITTIFPARRFVTETTN